MGAIVNGLGDYGNPVRDFIEKNYPKATDVTVSEIKFSSIQKMLVRAGRAHYVFEDDDILEQLDISVLDTRSSWRSYDATEKIIEESDRETIYQKAGQNMAKDAFIAELDRIYAGREVGNASGHPVHYIIRTEDKRLKRETTKLLSQALYDAGRISNKRCVYLRIRSGRDCGMHCLDSLYRSCEGGAVFIDCISPGDAEDEEVYGDDDTLEKICDVMKRYRNQVLTAFCLPNAANRIKAALYSYSDTICFVEINEKFAAYDEAKEYLKLLAEERDAAANEALFRRLEKQETYLAADLQAIFEEWYNENLRATVYPQYRELATVKKELEMKKPEGTAYEELMNMVGLDDVKALINEAINFEKSRKLFADRGLADKQISRHMVFTGEQGTAKTTVARLYARIMKENGILSKGRLIEVGRGDLVGKFVGWTAPIIKEKFKLAEGSVLFIDEAYSLLNGRTGSFGDEAINTIVQEMENHRDDVIVISPATRT